MSQKMRQLWQLWFWQVQTNFDNYWHTSSAHSQKLYAYLTFFIPSLLLTLSASK